MSANVTKAAVKSPATTVSGIAGAVGALLTLVVVPLTDADPNTAPNWAVCLPILAASLGLVFARDHGTTSEQAGAAGKDGAA